MKILIIVILAVAIMAGVFIFSGRKAGNPAETNPVSSPSNSVNDFTLNVLADDVYLKNPDEKAFVKIDKTALIKNGSEIKTSNTGRASILYPNGTISNLKENTDIVISDLADGGNKSRIKLLVGGIWAKIKNISGRGDSFQIETQNIVASVRGTILAVNFENQISWVAVLENKVSVQALDSKTGKEIGGAEVQLAEGEKTELNLKTPAKPGAALKKAPLTAEDFERNIIKENIKENIENESVKKILDNLQINSPSPAVKKSPGPSPQATVKPSASPTPTLTPKITPTPTSAPTPKPEAVIGFILPKSVQIPDNEQVEFTINGSNLTGTKKVLIGQNDLSFFVVDSGTIFAKITSAVRPGIYDVSIVTQAGKTLTLPQALEVK